MDTAKPRRASLIDGGYYGSKLAQDAQKNVCFVVTYCQVAMKSTYSPCVRQWAHMRTVSPFTMSEGSAAR